MAYRNHSNKVWTAVLAVLLAIVIAGVAALVGFLSDGFKNWDKFKDEEQAEQTDETADGAIIGESVGSGVKVMSAKIAPENYAANNISPMAESAYTLTATITPDNADNKTVDWSVAFVNPASEWATGKVVTDYVTVTPTADGALTANVECLKAFGEQIKVLVKSRENPEISAECTVDFVKRISGMTFTPSDLVFPTSGYEFDVQYTDYTLDSEVTVTVSNYMKLTDGFKDAITTKFSQLTTKYRFNTDWWFTSSGAMIKGDLEAGILTFSGIPNTPAGCFTYPDDEYDSDQISEMRGYIDSAFRSAVSSYNDVQATFDVTYTVRYGEETYMSGTKTVECRFNYSSLTVPVGSLSLNVDALKF